MPLWRSRSGLRCLGGHGGLDARLGATSFGSTVESPRIRPGARWEAVGKDEGVSALPEDARSAVEAATGRRATGPDGPPEVFSPPGPFSGAGGGCNRVQGIQRA